MFFNALFTKSNAKTVKKYSKLHTLYPRKQREGSVAPSKYTAKKGIRSDISGIEFKSAMEANYARLLISKNIIWEYEPDLYTFPDNRWGIKAYVPDFKVYKRNKSFYYLELKGVLDIDSYNKMQLLKKYYPKVKLFYIPWDTYKIIEKHYKHAIPEWE